MDAYQIRRFADKSLSYGAAALFAAVAISGLISLIWFGITLIMPVEMNKLHPIAYWGLWPIPAWLLFISAVIAYSQWEELSLGLAKFLFFLINAAILYAIIRVLMFVL